MLEVTVVTSCTTTDVLTSSDVLPTSSDVVPTSNDVVPTSSDVVDTSTGAAITSTSAAPSSTNFILQNANDGAYADYYAVLNVAPSNGASTSNNERSLKLHNRAVSSGSDMNGTINFNESRDAATIFTLMSDGTWTSPEGLPAYLDNTNTIATAPV